LFEVELLFEYLAVYVTCNLQVAEQLSVLEKKFREV